MSDELVVEEPGGTVSVPAAALERIVSRAAERVDGSRARRRRGVEIALDGGAATVSLQLAARYGVVLPQLVERVQAEVREVLETMFELDVKRVDVTVEEPVER